MSKLWELQLMDKRYRQIARFDYRSKNVRHLSEQNSNFDDARRVTTENALTDLYIYPFGTKIVETINTAAVRQTPVTSGRATLSKKRLWRRCFPLNFAKFLRTPFLTKHLRWLLLEQNNSLKRTMRKLTNLNKEWKDNLLVLCYHNLEGL